MVTRIIPFLFLVFLMLCSCVRDFYVEDDECKSSCYIVSGNVYDDSSGHGIVNVSVDLKFEWGSRSVNSYQKTDSFGYYRFAISDSIFCRGYEKGQLDFYKSYYMNSNKSVDLNTLTVDLEESEMIELIPTGILSLFVTVNKENLKRLKTVVEGDFEAIEKVRNVSNPKPLLTHFSIGMPSNQVNQLFLYSSEESDDSKDGGAWYLIDSFPKEVFTYHKMRREIDTVIVN
ncbi:MAG: hypothetical protein AB8B74_08750 [Crocinitomicaceae bacterium]